MQSFRENSSENSTVTISSWQMPSNLLVSLATGPMLLGLLGNKVINQLLPEMGLYSEEIFRGDRLPMLNFPQSPQDL
ncbi:MAG: hypothetical protein WBA93_27785 [Microcoleaceae cyanobacterium]